jgi:hypothetical protein
MMIGVSGVSYIFAADNPTESVEFSGDNLTPGLSGKYYLLNSIDLSSFDNEDYAWMDLVENNSIIPIGFSFSNNVLIDGELTPFTGEFDGNNKASTLVFTDHNNKDLENIDNELKYMFKENGRNSQNINTEVNDDTENIDSYNKFNEEADIQEAATYHVSDEDHKMLHPRAKGFDSLASAKQFADSHKKHVVIHQSDKNGNIVSRQLYQKHSHSYPEKPSVGDAKRVRDLKEAQLPKDPVARHLARAFDRGDYKTINAFTNKLKKQGRAMQKASDDAAAKEKINRMRAARGLPLKEEGLDEAFKNWTFEMKPGDKTKVLHGDHKGKRGVVVSKHDDGAVYKIKHPDGSTMKHHISTLDEPVNESIEEGTMKPYVKPHYGDTNNPEKQTGWKSANKHGKTRSEERRVGKECPM